jgi:hypothetical protein
MVCFLLFIMDATFYGKIDEVNLVEKMRRAKGEEVI